MWLEPLVKDDSQQHKIDQAYVNLLYDNIISL